MGWAFTNVTPPAVILSQALQNTAKNFILEIHDWLNTHILINVIYNISRIKGIKNTIILVDAKSIKKNQTHFHDENTQQTGNFLTLLKSIYEKPTDNIILNGERLKAFSLITSESIQGCLFLPLLFNIVLEVLTRVIRQKRKKRHRERDRKREREREASRLDAQYC